MLKVSHLVKKNREFYAMLVYNVHICSLRFMRLAFIYNLFILKRKDTFLNA